MSVCILGGGGLWVIADVTDPDVIQTILKHLQQRAPPGAASQKIHFKAAQTDFFVRSNRG